jgi:hypothetical protein
MNPVATSDAAFRGGACPTPEYTIAYTGNYTTSADANCRRTLETSRRPNCTLQLGKSAG